MIDKKYTLNRDDTLPLVDISGNQVEARLDVVADALSFYIQKKVNDDLANFDYDGSAVIDGKYYSILENYVSCTFDYLCILGTKAGRSLIDSWYEEHKEQIDNEIYERSLKRENK